MEVPSPTPEKQLQALVYTGGQPPEEKQPGRKGPGGPGGHQVEHLPCGKGG